MQELQQIKQTQNNGLYLRLAFRRMAYDKIKFEKKQASEVVLSPGTNIYI